MQTVTLKGELYKRAARKRTAESVRKEAHANDSLAPGKSIRPPRSHTRALQKVLAEWRTQTSARATSTKWSMSVPREEFGF